MSYENYGIVQMEFVDGTDMDSAMVKVSSSLDAVEAALPDECGTPSIMEIVAFSSLPNTLAICP